MLSSQHHCLKVQTWGKLYTLISHGRGGVRWRSEAQADPCRRGSSTLCSSHTEQDFIAPDKTSCMIIMTSSCSFSCPRCNGAARGQREKITHPNSHTGLSLLLWPEVRFMDAPPPPTPPTADGLNITSKHL